MSSKSKPRFLHTVKAKMVTAYTVVFAVLAALGFMTAYLIIQDHLQSELDRFLSVKSASFEGRLTGEAEHDEHRVAVSEIPAQIREAALERVPGLHITACKMERKRQGDEYELGGLAGDHFYEIEFRGDGTIKEVERSPAGSMYRNLSALLAEDAAREGTGRVFYLVLSSEGKRLASSSPDGWQHAEATLAAMPQAKSAIHRTIRSASEENALRVFSRPLYGQNTIHVIASSSTQERILAVCRNVFLLALVMMSLIGAGFGWFIANRAMAGVQRVTDTARDIAGGNLGARVPVGNEGAEVEELAQAFNDMLTRLEALVFELKEISNNIAHDLRTPLTRIRGAAETTVAGEETIENYRAMAGDVAEECDRLVEMINTMLEIARADSGVTELKLDVTDLSELTQRACELMQPVAEAKNIELEQDLDTDCAWLRADQIRLQRVIANLLDNAIKYTPEDGRISVTTSRDNGDVKLAIRDTGVGIPEEEQKLVFDRFYRCDESRSKPGNGLGLSLVQAVVHAHGGEIDLDSAEGKGTEITILLPAEQRTEEIAER